MRLVGIVLQMQALRSCVLYVCYYGLGEYSRRQDKCHSHGIYNTLYFVIAVIPSWLRFLQVCLRVCLLIFFLVGFPFQFCCRSDFLLIYVVFQLWCRFEVLLSFCVIPVVFWSIMSFSSYGVVVLFYCLFVCHPCRLFVYNICETTLPFPPQFHLQLCLF